MNAMHLPGVHFRRISFIPSFHKYAGEMCHGVHMHITDRKRCDPFEAGMRLPNEILNQDGENSKIIPHFGASADMVAGTYKTDQLPGLDNYRPGKKTTSQILEEHRPLVAHFYEQTRKYHRYP